MQDVSLTNDSSYFSTSLMNDLSLYPYTYKTVDASNMATYIPNVAVLTAAKVPILCYGEKIEKKLT
jgi:hypothetical protein